MREGRWQAKFLPPENIFEIRFIIYFPYTTVNSYLIVSIYSFFHSIKKSYIIFSLNFFVWSLNRFFISSNFLPLFGTKENFNLFNIFLFSSSLFILENIFMEVGPYGKYQLIPFLSFSK